MSRYDDLRRAQDERLRASLLADHPCSGLCDDNEHIDLVYVSRDWQDYQRDFAPQALQRRWEWLYAVKVIEIRQVEAPPPRNDDHLRQVPLLGGNDPGVGAVAYGVRWRLP